MTQRISALGSVSFGWLHEQGDFFFDEAFFLDPRIRRDREQRMQEFVAARFPHDPVYSIEAHLVQVEGRQQPVILVGGVQPNLILAAAVGSRFVFYGDKDPDVTLAPLADLKSLDSLANIPWADTWPISMFLDQIHAVRHELGSTCTIIPPFFWDATGRATTHGIVTTAQKLVGERVFLEMADHSGFVGELFQWIVDSYATLIELFAEAANMRTDGLHTGDCSLCMVGPDQFAEFVLPHVNAMAERVGPLRLHSCGHSDHLLEVFQEVSNLASLNVGSNTSVAKIRERFGPLRIDLIPDTPLMCTATPQDVDGWVRQTFEENGDGAIQYQFHLDVGQPVENCLQIHRTLESLGVEMSRIEIY